MVKLIKEALREARIRFTEEVWGNGGFFDVNMTRYGCRSRDMFVNYIVDEFIREHFEREEKEAKKS